MASTEHSGSVRFQGAARHVARWVKLPTSCDAASVGNLLLRDWRLQPPSAVVTLVGPNCAADAVGITAPDAAGIGPEQVSAMTLEEGLRLATDLPLQEFRDGLRGALRVSNAWLITDGVSEGVGGLIGRPRPTGGEVEDLPCLGIASWEKVAQRGELAKARTGRCVMYENPKGTSYAGPDDLHLQPRHSHFLLLEDDARGGKGDGRGRLRKGLENFINEEDLSGDGVKTPIVLLVVNGGAETLERLCDALSEEPQDPILIVAGTGGAADDIFAYHNWRSRQEGESRTQGDSGVPGEHEAAQWLAAGPGRSAAYLDAARRLVPRIYERGQQKGHNSKAALGFYSFSRGYDDADAFKNAILASLLESCSNGQDDLMLAVQWGEASILTEILDQTYEEKRKATGLSASPAGVSRIGEAFESALIRVAQDLQGPEVIDVLLSLSTVDPSTIRLDRLFQYSRNRWELGVWDEQLARAQDEEEEERQGGEPQRVGRPWSRQIFEEFVEGYEEHLKARARVAAWEAGHSQSSDTLGGFSFPTTWTDLMIWAVLVNRMDLARRMWSCSKQPIRAALIASQLCRFLSEAEHLNSEEELLLANSATYESWAIRLLDAIPLAEEALPLLGLVPAIQLREPDAKSGRASLCYVWADSPLDSAIEDDGQSQACKAFTTHKHVRYLLNCYFAGDYPGSKVRISREASLLRVAAQWLFFFLPGTFCEVRPPRKAYTASVIDRNAAASLEDDCASSAAAAFATEREDLTWDAELLAESFDQRTDEACRRSESSWQDVWDDLVSGRGFYFYSVPKVKFVSSFIFSIVYNSLLTVLILGDPRPQMLGRMLPWGQEELRGPRMGTLFSIPYDVLELIFWIWTFLRLVAELREIQRWDREGIRTYFKGVWNKLDVMCGCLVLIIVIFRLGCHGLDGGQNAASAYFLHLSEGTVRCARLEEVSRVLYGLVSGLNWFRLLQYFDFWEQFGVLRIIFFEMVRTDFYWWMMFVIFISLGTGVCLAAMIPARMHSPYFPGLHESPFWAPFWGLLGDFDLGVVDDAIGWPEGTIGEGFMYVLHPRYMVPVVILIYMLFANIVLVNLLIAMMGSTYERLSERATEEWVYERAHLILEFKDTKGPLPPPLNIFSLLPFYGQRLLRFLARTFGDGQVAPERSEGMDKGVKFLSPPRVLLSYQRRELEALSHVIKEMKSEEEEQVGRRMDLLSSQLSQGQTGMARSLDELSAQLDKIASRLGQGQHRPAPVLGASRRASRPAVTRYIERNAPPAGLQPPASNPSPSRAAVTAPPSTSTPLVPPSYTEAFLASLPGAGTADAGQRAARTGAEAGEIGSAPP